MTRLTLRIDFDNCQLGPGKIKLLELIDRYGSITASGKMMDMSYRTAWLLIDELNNMFVSPLVETRIGGRGGGNARLTVLGRAVVQLYRGIEDEAHESAGAKLRELERHIRPVEKPAEKVVTRSVRSKQKPAKQAT
ncbi:MAG TPA: ModE family transcriptional regulator [Beijerinckiaceae bacterium]|jgi:molybdate transport system regulatory protein|nr:ModE family transcriptional regulator [Beijerinckiaceae bacterium]